MKDHKAVAERFQTPEVDEINIQNESVLISHNFYYHPLKTTFFALNNQKDLSNLSKHLADLLLKK